MNDRQVLRCYTIIMGAQMLEKVPRLFPVRAYYYRIPIWVTPLLYSMCKHGYKKNVHFINDQKIEVSLTDNSS